MTPRPIAIALLLLSMPAPPLVAATFTVDLGTDAALTDCLAGVPADCSLRGALQRANQNPGDDRIEFALTTDDASYQPSTAHWRLLVGATALPPIEDAVVIDGYSQPGASANTQPPDQGGLNSVLAIELVPSNPSGNSQSGLEISANFPAQAASTLRGLAINQFARQIQLGGDAAHRVEGCFLGTDIRGSAAAVSGSGNRGYGIYVLGSAGYVIGGTTPAARNLISGLLGGLLLQRPIDGLVVQGNLFGTDLTGTVALPQTLLAAISSSSAVTNARIGGDSVAARNVISGNPLGAIYFGGGSDGAFAGTRIEGNFIGTSADGIAPLGNGYTSSPQPAIQIFGSGDCAIRIGGDAVDAPNRIAYNAGAGVSVVHCRRVDAAGNRYRNNRGLAIDLSGNSGSLPDGPTPNDAGDADEGSNRLQNKPVIEQIVYGGGSVSLTYRVDTAAANAAWPLRIDVARGSGAGVPVDSYGLTEAGTSKTVTFPASLVQGLPFALIATDADGNASEWTSDTLFADGLDG